jgi:hypothetical protein
MFFLLSYGLLNLSAGLEGLIESPSWRPKFKVPCALSLLGSAACFAVMLMIDAGATIIAMLVTAIIFYLVKRRRLNAHWIDMRYGALASCGNGLLADPAQQLLDGCEYPAGGRLVGRESTQH